MVILVDLSIDKCFFSILQGQLLADHSTSEYAPTAQLVKSIENKKCTQNVKLRTSHWPTTSGTVLALFCFRL